MSIQLKRMITLAEKASRTGPSKCPSKSYGCTRISFRSTIWMTASTQWSNNSSAISTSALLPSIQMPNWTKVFSNKLSSKHLMSRGVCHLRISRERPGHLMLLGFVRVIGTISNESILLNIQKCHQLASTQTIIMMIYQATILRIVDLFQHRRITSPLQTG